VKARTWIQEFGTVTCVPAAVLSGVFKTRNLISAQDDGLTLFWAPGLARPGRTGRRRRHVAGPGDG